MSIANDLDEIASNIRIQCAHIFNLTNADGEELEPLLAYANEIEEIAEKLRH